MVRSFRFVLMFLMVLALFSPISNAQATTGTTFYVDNTNAACDDFGLGTLSKPFCKIATGESVAFSGDTVRVLAGTYAETVKPNSGNSLAPVTFSAAPGVIITGNGLATAGGGFRLFQCTPVCAGASYVVIDGFTITGTADHGIFAEGADHLTISRNHVSGSGHPLAGETRAGIYLSGTTNSTITGNTTDHNTMDGIRLVNTSTSNTVSNNVSFGNASEYSRGAEGINLITNSTGNTVIHNIVYANEDSGLNFYTGSGSNLVIGNVSYGNGDHGIDNNAAPNNTIIGNTIQGNVTAGINVENASGNATVMNNIVFDNGWNYLVGNSTPGLAGGQPGNIRVDALSTAGTNLDYNLYYLKGFGTSQVVWGTTLYQLLGTFQGAVSGQETHGLSGDPLFDRAAPIAERPAAAPHNMAINVGNYRLHAGSPAIDSANSGAPNEPVLDIQGRARTDIVSVLNTGAGPRAYDDRGAYEFWALYFVFLPMTVR